MLLFDVRRLPRRARAWKLTAKHQGPHHASCYIARDRAFPTHVADGSTCETLSANVSAEKPTLQQSKMAPSKILRFDQSQPTGVRPSKAGVAHDCGKRQQQRGGSCPARQLFLRSGERVDAPCVFPRTDGATDESSNCADGHRSALCCVCETTAGTSFRGDRSRVLRRRRVFQAVRAGDPKFESRHNEG